MEKDIKVEDTTWDEVKERAELMAAADEIASGDRSQKAAEALDEEKDEEDKKVSTVEFSREYAFDNGDGMKKYRSIDLSGMDELTTTDGEVFDRMLARGQHAPANKFKDTSYAKYVAMKVTGLPSEFFNMLSLRDMQLIVAVVNYYFLYGWV